MGKDKDTYRHLCLKLGWREHELNNLDEIEVLLRAKERLTTREYGQLEAELAARRCAEGESLDAEFGFDAR